MEEANLFAGTLVRKRADPWKIERFGCRDADSEAEETHEWGEAKR